MRLTLVTLLLTAIVATQACGKAKIPPPEEACHFQQNSYLQRVSWRTLPVTLYGDASLSEEQVTALTDAMEIWNKTLAENMGIEQTFVYGGTLDAHFGLKNDLLNVVSITSEWKGISGEQAETLLIWESTAILEADIRINGTKPYSTNPNGENDKIDLVALFVHELGHSIGLQHIETSEYTTMAEFLERGNTDRRRVGQVELDALKCEY